MAVERRMAQLLLVVCILCFFCVPVCAVDSLPEKLAFSPAEQEYLQEKKILRVSIISNCKPFSYQTENGGYQGLPIAILEEFSKASGVTLEYVPAESYSESLAQLAGGQADLTALLMEYDLSAMNSSSTPQMLLLPYLHTQSVLLQHKNTDLKSLSVVTLADVKGREPFTDQRKISAIYYANSRECLNAVRGGQADAALCDSFTGSALMQRYEARDLIAIPTTIMQRFGFGVPEQTDARLVCALQKTITNFSGVDVGRHLLLGSDYNAEGPMEFIYRYPFEIICFVTSIMFVAALALITYTKVNIHQHQALQGYEESYRLLSDTFGEAGLEYDYLNDRLTIFGKQSTLDIDQNVTHLKEKLRDKTIRLSLTAEDFERIIIEGTENHSFSAEFQCGVKSGEWVWYRLIYTVICTTESHRRPIRLVGCLANIDAEHAEKERLLKLSSNDQLTGLFNHATAEKKIRELLEQDAGSRTGLLAILDIDYFKQFNDQKGHLCGDDVLRFLGTIVRETFETEDIKCRWGGDEFLFFLVDEKLHPEELSARIESLRRKMNAYQYQDVSCPVTLSIGGARSYPGCTFDVLFQQADDALYLAKKHGRDQFWLYAPTEQKLSMPTGEDRNV